MRKLLNKFLSLDDMSKENLFTAYYFYFGGFIVGFLAYHCFIVLGW